MLKKLFVKIYEFCKKVEKSSSNQLYGPGAYYVCDIKCIKRSQRVVKYGGDVICSFFSLCYSHHFPFKPFLYNQKTIHKL